MSPGRNMDFEFSADQEMLRDTVRRFLADRAPTSYVREMLDDPRGTTDAVWRELSALGLTGILVPETHGGAGMGMVDMGVVLEEMGRAAHPGHFLSSAVSAVHVVQSVAIDDEQADLLPSLADGSLVATVALLEPGRRYDWRAPATTAKAGTDGWTLHGTKAHVPDGAAAGLLLVTASTDDGLGVFAVETDASGMTITPQTSVDGTRKQATVELNGAPARLLGTPGSAVETAVATAVDVTVVALVVDAVGAASWCLDTALAYAKEREQFGRPIGSFQAVKHLCADMLHDLELARAGSYYALWAVDAGDEAERHRAATMAKAYASDALFRVAASTIQVLAGIGFTWEHDAHLFYKRIVSMQQALGTSTDHLAELADLVL
ncbi:MAG TPA: acyl-CoA dehydrogenase family protein [Acidimicrobiia bacterium]|nr:acyl-CoA dehydrogenase family protein [Acidimicrobiia bacterium]